MEPYYDRDGITIHHGDCLDALDHIEGPIDAVIMDPPYASGARTEAGKNSSGAMVRGLRWNTKPIENDQMTTTGFVWLMREVALRIRPNLAEGGAVLSFIDWRQWPHLVGALESVNLRLNGQVVWDKGSYGLGNGFRAQHELVVFASKGTPSISDRSVGTVLRHKRPPNDDHPSPKPVGLMRDLIRVVVPPGGVVLDPFMGSGSTLVAARDLGRRAIGIEVEESYCRLTVNRLAQPSIFVEAV
jgi:DNA modification methylase